MGTYGNSTADEFELTRETQDEWAFRSHERALQAIDNGVLQKKLFLLKFHSEKAIR